MGVIRLKEAAIVGSKLETEDLPAFADMLRRANLHEEAKLVYEYYLASLDETE